MAATDDCIALIAPAAREAARRYGVWASVAIGQSILESGWGKSPLAQEYSNYFGVKWTGNPSGPFPGPVTGAVRLKTVERPDSGEHAIHAWFRTYADPEGSALDYAVNLASHSAYAAAGAFTAASADEFIRRVGPVYTGGDSNYSTTVLSLIDRYNLRRFDKEHAMPAAALNHVGRVTSNTLAKAREILAAAEAAGHTINIIYGYNPASVPEHSSGRALDFMCTRAAGDWIADYLWDQRVRLDVKWIIWWQRIRSTTPGKSTGWRAMADRGDATQNHKDHVHVFFGDRYAPPPGTPAVPLGLVPANATEARALHAGTRLVAHGFGRHYRVGPSVSWGPADEANLREFQMIRMDRFTDLGVLDPPTLAALDQPLFVSSRRHALEYHTPADVRLVKFATRKLGVAPAAAVRSPAWWNDDLARSDDPAYDPGRWYIEAQLNYQLSIGDDPEPPLGPQQWVRLGKNSGLFEAVE